MTNQLARLVWALSLVLLTLLLMPGCGSQVARVGREAGLAGQRASEIERQAGEGRALVENPPDGIPVTAETIAWLGQLNSKFLSIGKLSSQIGQSAKVITEAVPHIRDRESIFVRMLRLAMYVLILGGVVLILSMTDLGKAIKGFVWGLGLLIPKSVRTSAKFDAEHLLKHPDDHARATAVAARRDSDAAYDAAYVRENNKHKLRGTSE